MFLQAEACSAGAIAWRGFCKESSACSLYNISYNNIIYTASCINKGRQLTQIHSWHQSLPVMRTTTKPHSSTGSNLREAMFNLAKADKDFC